MKTSITSQYARERCFVAKNPASLSGYGAGISLRAEAYLSQITLSVHHFINAAAYYAAIDP